MGMTERLDAILFASAVLRDGIAVRPLRPGADRARTAAGLPAGARLVDYLSLGGLTARCPRDDVQDALLSTGRVSARERDLPAHVMMSYAIALAL